MRIKLSGTQRRAAAAAAAIAALAVFAVIRQFAGDAGASRARPFGDAIAVLQQDDGAAAATVNGRPIPQAKLKAFAILSAAGDTFGVPGKPASEADYLNSLIDSELLFQEASSRGLLPTDQDVLAFAKQSKQSLLQAMKENSDFATKLQQVFSEVVGTPYHVEAYDSSPVMLDIFRHQLATGALRNEILQQLPVAERNDPQKRDAAINAVLSAARARADIRILVPATK